MSVRIHTKSQKSLYLCLNHGVINENLQQLLFVVFLMDGSLVFTFLSSEMLAKYLLFVPVDDKNEVSNSVQCNHSYILS